MLVGMLREAGHEFGDVIGSDLSTRNFAELLIDCEEGRVFRAVLVGMLRERQQ